MTVSKQKRHIKSKKYCKVCSKGIPTKRRSDAIYCSETCRKAAYVVNNAEKRRETQRKYREKRKKDVNSKRSL